MYHLISNFNGVLLLGWGILHPVCASRQHFLAIVTSSINNSRENERQSRILYDGRDFIYDSRDL